MQADILEPMLAEAIRLGANALEVEYSSGYEEVIAIREPVGFGIARLRSGSREAARLREECYRLARLRRGQRIQVDGRQYEVRAAVRDDFGEDAFGVTWRPVANRSSRKSPQLRRPAGGSSNAAAEPSS